MELGTQDEKLQWMELPAREGDIFGISSAGRRGKRGAPLRGTGGQGSFRQPELGRLEGQ